MLRLLMDRIFRFVGLMLIMLICFVGCAGIDNLVQEGRYDEAAQTGRLGRSTDRTWQLVTP